MAIIQMNPWYSSIIKKVGGWFTLFTNKISKECDEEVSKLNKIEAINKLLTSKAQ